MRNYTNTEKTATICNLYNGDEFTVSLPFSDDVELSLAIMRATSNGDHDYVVFDEENNFYGFADSNYIGIEELNDIAERIEVLEDEDADKLEAMAEYCDDLDDVERCWGDSYFVPDTTLADYAEELCYDCGYMPSELPGWISYHIDWEGVGRELSFDGYSEINGGVLYVAQ